RRHGGGPAHRVAGDLPALPHADEQQALGLGTARVQERGLVALPFEVSALDRPRYHAARRAVELGERSGERAPLRDRDGGEGCLDLGERESDVGALDLRHARLCTRRMRRSRPPWPLALAAPNRTSGAVIESRLPAL